MLAGAARPSIPAPPAPTKTEGSPRDPHGLERRLCVRVVPVTPATLTS
jgi:hypothetical protein